MAVLFEYNLKSFFVRMIDVFLEYVILFSVNGYMKWRGKKMSTIKDVAKLAGVSVATVSRVLNKMDMFMKIL